MPTAKGLNKFNKKVFNVNTALIITTIILVSGFTAFSYDNNDDDDAVATQSRQQLQQQNESQPFSFTGNSLFIIPTQVFLLLDAYGTPGIAALLQTDEINDSTQNGPSLSNHDQFGSAVADIGDLDSDGVDDIAVGAYGGDGGKGEAHIMFMNSNGTIKNTVEINDSTQNGPSLSNNDRFGVSVADIGDLDGDGTRDIVIGAHEDDNGGTGSGAVHIMLMNSNGTIKNTVEINDSTQNGPALSSYDYFGISVAGIGDLDGDGVIDIVAGAYGDGNGGAGKGTIHIMLMNSNGTVKNTVEINDSTQNGPSLSNLDHFGSSVADIGDLDGDGIRDIAAGAYDDDNGGSSNGAVHIMLMNSNGTVKNTVEINDSTPNGPSLSNNDQFGSSVAGIGDLDGDGVIDIVAGAYGDDRGGQARGAIHIMLMNSDGTIYDTIEINGSTSNGPSLNNYDYFGSSVAGIGDLDGDGTRDIAAGAYGDGGGGKGAIHVMLMDNSDTTAPVITLNGTTPVTLELGIDTYTESGATVADNDSTYSGNVTVAGDAVNTATAGNYTVTYDAPADASGNNATQVTRTVSVTDTIAPIITLNGTTPVTLELGIDTYTESGATVADNDSTYSGNVTVAGDAVNTATAGNYTVTYDAPADASGNNATQVTRTISVTDTIAPIITLNGTTPVTLELGIDTYTEPDVTVADNDPAYSGTVTVGGDTVNTNLAGNYTVTYDATADAAGNNATQVTRTVNVVDTTVPIITLNGTTPVMVKLGVDTYTELGATVTDNDSNYNGTVSSTGTVDTATAGNYTITYSAPDDAAGNTPANVTRAVAVVYFITNVTSTADNGTYTVGDKIDITVTLDESVTVNIPSVSDGTGGFDKLDGAAGVDTVTVGNSTYAIVASWDDDGVQIINITNPASPTPTASVSDSTGGFDKLDGARGVDTVTVGNSTYAIVASLHDGVQIINITNPASPTRNCLRN